ncbi:nuclear transport factor 2 family protein [Gordonia hydrophobica]|uniref:Nuclear transport factor 2 family protein n=1 Tax=Gordonia hydrophobica TaxID=40516 RepID=A0ABZ2TZI8_9ACTN|nr:nuclear transport factor 2 family protein [Gordonia hydrophobica]MBM7369220.1 ketosteroid isomerase-like protein [Gordonia hydrophobica]
MTDQWILDYFAAWTAEDPEGVASFVTDDCVYEDVTAGHISRGRHQVANFVRISNRVVPNVTYDVVSGHSTPTAYAAEWIMQPQGLRGSSVGTLVDGKISSNRDYWDGATFKLPEPAEKK